jgi:hypothetical protein
VVCGHLYKGSRGRVTKVYCGDFFVAGVAEKCLYAVV